MHYFGAFQLRTTQARSETRYLISTVKLCLFFYFYFNSHLISSATKEYLLAERAKAEAKQSRSPPTASFVISPPSEPHSIFVSEWLALRMMPNPSKKPALHAAKDSRVFQTSKTAAQQVLLILGNFL